MDEREREPFVTRKKRKDKIIQKKNAQLTNTNDAVFMRDFGRDSTTA